MLDIKGYIKSLDTENLILQLNAVKGEIRRQELKYDLADPHLYYSYKLMTKELKKRSITK